MREWLKQNYQGVKAASNPVWLDLLNAASEVDFAVAQCKGHSQIMAMLATSDSCEIKLRRIAAEEYMVNTGDTAGANEMLAIKPPGVAVHLAPTWLVADCTVYSKTEHQRAERVRSASVSRPRGRGAAARGGGRGGQQGQQQQQAQGEAQGNEEKPRGRGRGRGRK